MRTEPQPDRVIPEVGDWVVCEDEGEVPSFFIARIVSEVAIDDPTRARHGYQITPCSSGSWVHRDRVVAVLNAETVR